MPFAKKKNFKHVVYISMSRELLALLIQYKNGRLQEALIQKSTKLRSFHKFIEDATGAAYLM
jgi:hypothetical protein